MSVLTNRGLITCKELNIDDRIYNGSEFTNTYYIKDTVSDIDCIDTVRGYNINGKFNINVIRNDILTNVNSNDIKIDDLLISHKSYVYETLDNIADLSTSGYKHSNNLKWQYCLPNKLTEDLCYLLGYSYGDGYLPGPPNYILALACSDDYPEITKTIIRIIKESFDYTARIKRGDGKLEIVYIQLKPIINFLIDNKIAKQKAGFLELPKLVMNSNSKNMRAFFSGHFDADGYASGHKKGYCLNSIDYKILKEYQLYLSLNNIITTIHREDRSKQGWQTMWSLHILGGGSQKNAIEQFRHSYKIQNKNFIASKDFVKTPYTPVDIEVNHRKCGVEYKTTKVSFGRLQELGAQIYQNEYINDISKISTTTSKTISLGIKDCVWCNGFIIS